MGVKNFEITPGRWDGIRVLYSRGYGVRVHVDGIVKIQYMPRSRTVRLVNMQGDRTAGNKMLLNGFFEKAKMPYRIKAEGGKWKVFRDGKFLKDFTGDERLPGGPDIHAAWCHYYGYSTEDSAGILFQEEEKSEVLIDDSQQQISVQHGAMRPTDVQFVPPSQVPAEVWARLGFDPVTTAEVRVEPGAVNFIPPSPPVHQDLVVDVETSDEIDWDEFNDPDEEEEDGEDEAETYPF